MDRSQNIRQASIRQVVGLNLSLRDQPIHSVGMENAGLVEVRLSNVGQPCLTCGNDSVCSC